MIEHGDGWAGTTSMKILLQMQLSGQQVQLPQVFQLEDPGVEDPACIQGADNHGQSNASPTWLSWQD
jgi:hypothetical protein